jgi:hypothetical protein
MSRDALLTIAAPGEFLLEFDGSAFGPAPASAAALGALLFALSPSGIRYEASTPVNVQNLEMALKLATRVALALHHHANRPKRATHGLPPPLTLDDARGWVTEALALVPLGRSAEVTMLMERQLGPNPWCLEHA